jgi:TolB-like protein
MGEVYRARDPRLGRDVITDLAKIQALRVISRTSIMQYKGAKKPLPQIAKESLLS